MCCSLIIPIVYKQQHSTVTIDTGMKTTTSEGEHSLSRLKEHIKSFGKVRTIWRVIWFSVVLGSTIGCLVTITDRIKYLISDPLSTTISVTKQPALTFPAVTVCNLNLWRADSFDAALSGLVRQQVYQNNSSNELNCEDLESLFSNISTYEELTVQARYHVEDLIISCEFATKDCGNLTEVFKPVFTNLGMCYTFNSGKVRSPLQSVGAGERHGLRLEVNINQYQYLTSEDAGVKIAVHSQSEPPLPDDFGIGVPTGNKAFIRIKQRNIEDQTHSKKFKHCRSNNDLSTFNFLRGEFNTYSETACLVDCQYTSIADDCACIGARSFYSPDTAHYSQLPNCTLKSMCCIDNDFLSPRNCTCPVACSSVSYDTSVSYSTYPTEYVPDYYSSIDFLIVSVYFETLNVETYTTYHAYSFVSLLSDIGGQSGLFLGLSIISVLEFGDWILKKIEGRDLSADMENVKNKCCSCCQTHSSVALDENSYNLVDTETSN